MEELFVVRGADFSVPEDPEQCEDYDQYYSPDFLISRKGVYETLIEELREFNRPDADQGVPVGYFLDAQDLFTTALMYRMRPKDFAYLIRDEKGNNKFSRMCGEHAGIIMAAEQFLHEYLDGRSGFQDYNAD